MMIYGIEYLSENDHYLRFFTSEDLRDSIFEDETEDKSKPYTVRKRNFKEVELDED